MERIIWYIIMIPCSAVFTIIGLYARSSKKPMWFWSGSTVKESEITDIPAYNRANGIMWLLFSLPLWVSTFLGIWSPMAACVLLAATFVAGFPILIYAYHRISKKYRA